MTLVCDANRDEFRRYLMELGDMFRGFQRDIPQIMERYTGPLGLTFLASDALEQISRAERGATLTEIGEAINVSPSTMTGIATRLTQLGYVTRSRSTEDGRAWVLNVTPEGLRAVDTVFDEFVADLTDILSIRSGEELMEIGKSFERVVAFLQDMQAIGNERLTGEP